jgi:hypothetical protein
MDEDLYRQTYHELNARPCPFEKAILRTCGACSQARRFNIAEREAVGCMHPGAWQRCLDALSVWRQKATFAIQLPQVDAPLPHGKEIKVQCGGILGLQRVLDAAHPAAATVTDIYDLLEQATSRFGGVDAFPYEDIVRTIAHYKSRGRD